MVSRRFSNALSRFVYNRNRTWEIQLTAQLLALLCIKEREMRCFIAIFSLICDQEIRPCH